MNNSAARVQQDQMLMTDEFAGSFWSSVCDIVRNEIGDKKFSFWVQSLYLIHASAECVEIGCPNTLLRDYVSKNFARTLERAVQAVAPSAGPLKFTYAPRTGVSAPEPEVPSADPIVTERMAPGSIKLNPSYTFRDFVVGKPNNVAATAAQQVADAVGAGAMPKFNPLFLFGQSGLGKTHLLHAIVWQVMQNNPNAKVLFITAETFMRRFINAIKEKGMMAFKDEMQSVDLLLIDDLQFIADGEKAATQEEFFHRFSELVSQGTQVVFSADRSPAHLDKLAERIRTRMLHGLTAEVHSPDLEMRIAIVERKLERLVQQYPGVTVPDDVKRFLAARMPTNTRELEGALQQIVYVASVTREPLDIELARRELADRLNLTERRLTVEEIKRIVAGFYGIRVQDMDSPRRTRNLVRPRQTAMFLAKTLTPRSYPEIGRRFGNRDHTTVMHAVKQIERLTAADPVMADEVDLLRRMLKEGIPGPGRKDGDGGQPL
jgi:chromosomal replication initiator protein